MSKFQELVTGELDMARYKHPKPHNSLHEGYAVLLEEVDELWDEVRKQNPVKDRVLWELIQIAAVAQRTAEDLKLL